jgi:YesN/AraC family two-component response regulator
MEIRKAFNNKQTTGNMAQILIIDDDPQILDMLGQTLEREGYEVVRASNGKEGIKINRETPVDLIITDIIMPEKEGIETIFELKKDFPYIKIIAISGGGQIEPEDYLYIAKKIGVHRTFVKPISREELLKAVSELLK